MSQVIKMFVSSDSISKEQKLQHSRYESREIKVSDGQILMIFCSKIKRYVKIEYDQI